LVVDPQTLRSGIVDSGEFPVILGSKDWPMRVDWVRVWGEPG
jgi:hypothetical protein